MSVLQGGHKAEEKQLAPTDVLDTTKDMGYMQNHTHNNEERSLLVSMSELQTLTLVHNEPY